MTRAAPMPPEERRASIIETTLPLLLEHGTSLTTKQVAEAAGVAEGTIFRVFASLADLIDATTREALSAHRLQRDIDATLPGDTLLSITEAAIELLIRRMRDVGSLLHTAHKTPESDGDCLRGELEARKLELSVWISSQLEPHADELRVSPTDYAELLRTLALGHVMTHTASTFTPHSLATFALHGAGKAN